MKLWHGIVLGVIFFFLGYQICWGVFSQLRACTS